jgi:hypothetical protein
VPPRQPSIDALRLPRDLARKRAPEGVSPGRGLPLRSEKTMAKSQKKSNKEVRKPKAEKVKTIAANASTKDKPVSIVNIR